MTALVHHVKNWHFTCTGVQLTISSESNALHEVSTKKQPRTKKTEKNILPCCLYLSCPADQRCDWLVLGCSWLIRGGSGTLLPYSQTQSLYKAPISAIWTWLEERSACSVSGQTTCVCVCVFLPRTSLSSCAPVWCKVVWFSGRFWSQIWICVR